MATATLVQMGNHLDFTPASDQLSGDVIVQGELVGIMIRDTLTGVQGAIDVEGVYKFPKKAPLVLGAGALVYWDAGAVEATDDPAAGANKLIGKTTAEEISAATTVKVKLDQ